MSILVLILKWSYASLVGAEAREVKFSPNFLCKESLGSVVGHAVVQPNDPSSIPRIDR